MGQIILNIASDVAKRVLHIATLGNMQLAEHAHADKSSRNPYLDSNISSEYLQNLKNVSIRNDEMLRVPGDGYPYQGLYSMPLNNIIIEDVEKTFKIEFINAKCKITKANTIVETPVVNRDGTVKEFINAKDYDIVISGDIISDSQYYFPVDEMKTLIGLLSKKTNLNVESSLMYMFDIKQMVFKSGTFDQSMAKYVNAMPFSLTFVSDIDYDFLVEDDV
ncbi:MAG: DUF6046 domain-containing protein [Prevotellaceae bacterium]|jgi:hypothetical protein|nr:DUF6046 domain-containing protein [Prevotellaceae bacterium]